MDRIASEHGQATAERFRERLKSSQGYQVVIGGSTAGWLWTTQNPRLQEGAPPFLYAIHPRLGSAYMYDGYTAPAARQQGVMKALFGYVLAELKQQQVRCAFFTHHDRNSAMNHLAQASGFAAVGQVRYRRCLGREWRDVTELAKVCADVGPTAPAGVNELAGPSVDGNGLPLD